MSTINKRYLNGEIITKARMEDEEWYGRLYQPFLEYFIGAFQNKWNEVDEVYEGAIIFFKEFFEEDLSPENKERILRWSVLHVERQSYNEYAIDNTKDKEDKE